MLKSKTHFDATSLHRIGNSHARYDTVKVKLSKSLWTFWKNHEKSRYRKHTHY